MADTGIKDKVIFVRADQDLHSTALDVAQTEGIPLAELSRRALKWYLATLSERPQQEVLQQTG